MVVMLLLRAMALLVRLRALPVVNEVELPPEIEERLFVKLTVRLFTKFAEDVPKPNEEFETVPPLSLTRIEARPAG